MEVEVVGLALGLEKKGVEEQNGIYSCVSFEFCGFWMFVVVVFHGLGELKALPTIWNGGSVFV